MGRRGGGGGGGGGGQQVARSGAGKLMDSHHLLAPPSPLFSLRINNLFFHSKGKQLKGIGKNGKKRPAYSLPLQSTVEWTKERRSISGLEVS